MGRELREARLAAQGRPGRRGPQFFDEGYDDVVQAGPVDPVPLLIEGLISRGVSEAERQVAYGSSGVQLR